MAHDLIIPKQTGQKGCIFSITTIVLQKLISMKCGVGLNSSTRLTSFC